jgi:hypothetical protein
MGDEADRADALIEMVAGCAIAAARQALPDAQATGACLWCGDEVSAGRRWCDADCRDDWERYRARSRRR